MRFSVRRAFDADDYDRSNLKRSSLKSSTRSESKSTNRIILGRLSKSRGVSSVIFPSVKSLRRLLGQHRNWRTQCVLLITKTHLNVIYGRLVTFAIHNSLTCSLFLQTFVRKGWKIILFWGVYPIAELKSLLELWPKGKRNEYMTSLFLVRW